ncbi:hypothetical protein ABL78_0740 [Leptomonas seymouri]|uniref:Uncharacterized protein n=1 Tax=Leptomonas seymouri TaxID=5684 RepID=A0A0N1IMD8_LEPSE|nr:hypothetical protein ABL78_0740 [Leptomonas seymouri]|eukprot:KPI90095.1 hypothetical protein ABL78_0740 [Leptomonas seymouri]
MPHSSKISSNYSVSSSESGSFGANAALHHASSCKTPSAAATGSERCAETAAAASVMQSDATPQKAAQSSKFATTTQESPSMTIRRLPADYSKQMAEQKARSNALERYKMLVKSNRLVPSDDGASPDPKKTTEAEDIDLSTTWRRGEQLPSSIHREGSAISQTVLSNLSDEDDDGAAGNGAVGRELKLHKDADPRPQRSISRRQQQQQPQQRGRLSWSPVSVSVSVERPVYPNSTTHAHEVEPAAAVPAVPVIDLTKTLPHQAVQQPPSSPAVLPPVNRCIAPPGGEEEVPADYVSPELTQPFGNTNLKPRNSIRPDYKPVTDHNSSLTRTSSLTGEGQRTPRKQLASSQVRCSSVGQGRASASPNGSSTPRRRSAVKTRCTAAPAADAAVVSEETAPVETRHVDAAVTPTRAEEHHEVEHQDEALMSLRQKAENGVLPLPGSKTAFWLRPSSAMYEMTTSIAAKRKEYAEHEGITSPVSSRRGSRSFHAIPSGGSSSLYGTPRSRGGPNAATALPEERPRFSTHMSAADRKLYEEGGAAINPTPASTYDAIFTNRQCVMQRSSARRSQEVGSVTHAVGTTASSVASSTPRGTPRGVPQRRAVAPRADVVQSPSSLSRLSSNTLLQTPTEGPPSVNAGRVSARQQDALTKHCARVAARDAARAEELAAAAPLMNATTAEANIRKVKKSVPAAAGATTVAAQLKAQPTAASASVHVRPQLKRAAAPVQAGRGVRSVLECGATKAEKCDEPSWQMVAPEPTRRFSTPARQANEEEREVGRAAAPDEPSPHTTVHGRHADEDATPSKSRRREYDVTASPPRDEATDGNGDDNAHCAAQCAAMALEKKAARAQQAREVLESSRLARQSRTEAARTSHSLTAGAPTSTNDIVAAMLQGTVQQTRQVLPCYLCGELQCTSGYRVHVSACRPKMEGILREYFTAVAGLADIPDELKERIERLASQEVPSSNSDVSVRDAFAKECYQCLKSTLAPCRKCGTHLRVQDLKEHEMLCGRSYYMNSRAAERVSSAADRIERGAQG